MPALTSSRSKQRYFAEKNSPGTSVPGAYLLAGLLVGLGGSCQPPAQSPVATAATSRPAPLPAGAKILIKNRRFVYAVRWYAPDATTAQPDTVMMTARGTPWVADSAQTAIVWSFPADSLWPEGPTQEVGAIENKEEFWLHPPRYGRYRILELNPFPHIKLPAVSGRTWEFEVYPPAMYADSAWATWQGVLHVKFHYKLGGSTQLATPLGSLPCYRVQATGTSKLGITTSEACFHPAYGFVRLNYCNIDRSRTELEMVAVNVQPESSEHALEQLLLKWGGAQPTR